MILFENNNVAPNGIFLFNNEGSYSGPESFAQPIYRIYLGDKCIFPKTDLNTMYRIEITEDLYVNNYYSGELSGSYNEYRSHYTSSFIVETLYPCFVKEITSFLSWSPIYNESEYYLRPSKALVIIFPYMIGNSWKLFVKAADNYFASDYYVDGPSFDSILYDDACTICPSELDTTFITQIDRKKSDSMYRHHSSSGWEDWSPETPFTSTYFSYLTPALLTAYSDNSIDWNHSANYIWLRTPTSQSTNTFSGNNMTPTYENYGTPYTLKSYDQTRYVSSQDFTLTFSRPADSSKVSSSYNVSGSNKFDSAVSFLEKTEGTPLNRNYKDYLLGEPFAYVVVTCSSNYSEEKDILLQANGVTYGPIRSSNTKVTIPFDIKSTVLDVRFINFNQNASFKTQVVFGVNYYTLKPVYNTITIQNCGDDRLFSRLSSLNSNDIMLPCNELLNYYDGCVVMSKNTKPSSITNPNLVRVWQNLLSNLGYDILRGAGNTAYNSLLDFRSYKLPIGNGKTEQVLCGKTGKYNNSWNYIDNKVPFYRFFNGIEGGMNPTARQDIYELYDTTRSYSINMCNTPSFETIDEWKRELLGG